MHCHKDLPPLYETALHPHQPIPEPPPPETEEQKKGTSHGICPACFDKHYPDPDAEPASKEVACSECGYVDHEGAKDSPCPSCGE
jgi:hypothetical protein